MGSSEVAASDAFAAAELAARWATVVPFRDELLAIARRRCPTPQDAEDCVQEAMLRAVAYPKLDAARVGSLLTTLTVRASADLARRRSTELRGQHRLVVVPHQTALPDEALADRDEARWLFEQVERLPERERQVFEHRAAGLSATETASVLQLSYKAVESAFTRARGRLRLWAVTASLLAASLVRRARSRPAMLTAALIASVGGLIAVTPALHGRSAPGRPTHVAALTGGPSGPGHSLAIAPAGADPGLGPTARRAWYPGPSTRHGGGSHGGDNSAPPGTISVHTGPVNPPGPLPPEISDLGVTVNPNDDVVGNTQKCIPGEFSLDPHHLGCPPNP